MPNPPVRFAIMGTGRITRRLIAEIQTTPDAVVTAIGSRSSDRAQWQADNFGIPNAIGGYEELLRREDVDAVYIALPPSLHCQWTVAACQAGKHVLCERPMAVNAGEVRQMFDAADAAGVRLLDATAWLHHDRTEQFRHWLTTTDAAADTELPFQLGTLRHLSASVSFRSPFQSGDHRLDESLGGGCLLDLGWYAAGLIRFAAGRLPVSVFADGVRRDGILSRVSGTMLFDNDLTATLSCGFDTATRKWCEIAGEDASIVCDDFTRPWPDKPARSWVHEASGKVHSFSAQPEPTPTSDQSDLATADQVANNQAPSDQASCNQAPCNQAPCNQERQMVAELVRRIRSEDTTACRNSMQQALETQIILDALAKSIELGSPVSLAELIGGVAGGSC